MAAQQKQADKPETTDDSDNKDSGVKSEDSTDSGETER